MARVYATKGAEAKTHKLTVPMTAALHDKVVAKADEIGKDKTTVARMLIESGLRRDEKTDAEPDLA